MVDRHLQLPSKKGMESAYEEAIKLAREQLSRLDIEKQCQNCGARYQIKGSNRLVFIEYLNKPCVINLSNFEISQSDSNETIPIKSQILILHYLAQAKGTSPTNKLVSIKELPDGRNYSPTFSKRAINPIVNNFSNEPDRLIEAAEYFGGYKADYGDAAITINAFSRVPITIAIWQGDDEFSPTGNVMFDANISDYLSTYDIIELCENIAWSLVRSYRQSGK